ncbi:MAG TPA: hypothetical protein VE641_15935 [Chthoniobacterales bacterium]|nr:hypothetical protein [Chthoniobacterales bacterium]
MQLQEVVPWGRSLDEYRRQFALSETDLKGCLLGCGDGPASFNAELAALGETQRLVSVDPLYAFTGPEIAGRVEQTYEKIISQVRRNHERYVWTYFTDPDVLGAARLHAMKMFLNDYEVGRAEGRYLVGALPKLPFNNGEFDLCLCSHLLFLYSAQLSADFHLASMLEMLRVAQEVRVFPLLDLDLQRSAHLDPVMADLRSAHFYAEIVDVPYIFQKGGGQMLRVVRRGQRIERDPQNSV